MSGLEAWKRGMAGEERHGLEAWAWQLGMGLRHGLEDGLGLRHGLEAWGREGWLGLNNVKSLETTLKQISKLCCFRAERGNDCFLSFLGFVYKSYRVSLFPIV